MTRREQSRTARDIPWDDSRPRWVPSRRAVFVVGVLIGAFSALGVAALIWH